VLQFPEVQVQEAAVIGIPHPKWTERPLMIVVRSKGSNVTKEEVLHFLEVGSMMEDLHKLPRMLN